MLLADKDERMAYRIARGEQGVLTFEPYKSHLLPHWRFRTPAIARTSAKELWGEFETFAEQGDFVGMDMARKFIQMGMTRAKRYANYKGGRKYDAASGKKLDISADHEGKKDKLEASNIFREYWEQCRKHEVYLRLKEDFIEQQKDWDKKQTKITRQVKKEDQEKD